MKRLNNAGEQGNLAYVSIFGTTQIHLRSPMIAALWSMAFPGFGHLLLSKYLRGFALVIWEIYINQTIHLNTAMVYTFMGDIDAAKSVLDVQFMHLYIPVYLFAIWDSYRTAVDLNKVYLSHIGNKSTINQRLIIRPLEINYLDKRCPVSAFFWSMAIPSVGHFYNHRIVSGLFTLVTTVIYVYHSHLLEGIHYLILGRVETAINVLDKQWLLYMPSFYFFTIYDAYVGVIENNKLFNREQSALLKKYYQKGSLLIDRGWRVR
ncbi:hypothetical protein ACNA6I_06125 [Rossellomorea sp. FS2]|uniref:hypothetical protein n=1 Tax=Rossellomorea sp. FS2 TaxID=3391447 RepID=UPI003A4DF6CD